MVKTERLLDGLRHRPPGTISSPGATATRARSARSVWWRIIWASGLLGLSLASLVLLLLGTVAATLPFPSWSDRLTLLRFLRPGTYLVLFQNPRELRPTGGFIGSFAEVELGWGLHIKNFEVETNIYARDATYAGTITTDPPEPLRAFLGDQPWALRDSNWNIDFPEAAATIAWFYEHEGGQPVDGVIAIDARLLERILRLTGPIELPSYQTTLTADTVIDTLQKEIEQDYWLDPDHAVENQPKSILNDLSAILLTKIRHQPPQHLLAAVINAFGQKEVLVAVHDQPLAAALAAAHWDGSILETDADYLTVNEANLTPVDGRSRIVGAKSSWSIDRTLSLRRTPGRGVDAPLVHELTMNRQHNGQGEWPDGPNQSYLRVLIPEGSILVTATRNGETIVAEVRSSREAGKTALGLWSRLDPGQKETITLVYQINIDPIADQAELFGPLVLQRQPGAPPIAVEIWDDQTLRWQGSLTEDVTI